MEKNTNKKISIDAYWYFQKILITFFNFEYLKICGTLTL